MNRISSRQLFFFLACVAPVGKIVLMPSHLVYRVQNDLLLPALLNYATQALAVFCVLLLVKEQKSFYELLLLRTGKVVAKAVYAFFMLFCFFAALIPVLEQSLLVQNIFYDTLPSVLTFAPFFLFSAFLCAKPLACRGRAWDILGPAAIFSFCGLIAFSLMKADFGALLPVGISGGKNVLQAAGDTLGWFCDPLFLLLLLGKVDYRKGIALRGAICYLLGGIAVMLFLAVYYGIFSSIALRQIFAFAKISKYFSGITMLGRIDFLFIYLLSFVMTFYCSLPLHACVHCAGELFGEGKLKTSVFSVAVNGGMLLLTVLFNLSFQTVSNTVLRTLFWVFPIFTLLVPLLSLFLRRKRYE